jgi:AraC-like DNA-binding protein
MQDSNVPPGISDRRVSHERRALYSRPQLTNSLQINAIVIGDSRVVIMLEKLKENPALSLNELAAILKLSPSRLRHLVQKEELGFNLQSFRQECQLLLARQLLHASGLPLKVIRSRCGIPDAANFNRLFKNKFKSTPGQYRLRRAAVITNE